MSTLSEKHAQKKAEKRIEREEAEAGFRLNQIKPATNALFNVMFVILSIICVFPFILVLMISISSEESIRNIGYALIPQSFSSAAYEFLWNERDMILQSLFVSIEVTVIGTVLGVVLTTTMGYVLSRPQFKLRGFLQWVVFIPMIFTGGMVANYVVTSNILHLNDTLWCLVLPLAVSSWNVTISKTFFRQTIPDSIIESAKIDGASQLTIFARIVVPISKPVFATVALFLTFGYWNDWLQAALYISKDSLRALLLADDQDQPPAWIQPRAAVGEHRVDHLLARADGRIGQDHVEHALDRLQSIAVHGLRGHAVGLNVLLRQVERAAVDVGHDQLQLREAAQRQHAQRAPAAAQVERAAAEIRGQRTGQQQRARIDVSLREDACIGRKRERTPLKREGKRPHVVRGDGVLRIVVIACHGVLLTAGLPARSVPARRAPHPSARGMRPASAPDRAVQDRRTAASNVSPVRRARRTCA